MSLGRGQFQGNVIFLFEKRSSLQTPTFSVPFRKVVGIAPRRPRRRRIRSRRRKCRRLDLKNKSRSNRRIADFEIASAVSRPLSQPQTKFAIIVIFSWIRTLELGIASQVG